MFFTTAQKGTNYLGCIICENFVTEYLKKDNQDLRITGASAQALPKVPHLVTLVVGYIVLPRI